MFSKIVLTWWLKFCNRRSVSNAETATRNGRGVVLCDNLKSCLPTQLWNVIFRLHDYLAALQSIRYAHLSSDAVNHVSDAINRACARKWTKTLRDQIDYYWMGFERSRVHSEWNNHTPRTSNGKCYAILLWFKVVNKPYLTSRHVVGDISCDTHITLRLFIMERFIKEFVTIGTICSPPQSRYSLNAVVPNLL